MTVELVGPARWFSRVVWLGIAANLALSLPTLLAPVRLLQFSNLPVPEPVMWTQFAALLLVLLSAFYVPAALDPNRYRIVAWLSVAARLAGVVFFGLFQPPQYRLFGYFDLAFFIPELGLLVAMAKVPAARVHAFTPRPASSAGRSS